MNVFRHFYSLKNKEESLHLTCKINDLTKKRNNEFKTFQCKDKIFSSTSNWNKEANRFQLK